MRFIYKLLLGLLLFNVLLVSFAPFFPAISTDDLNTQDVSATYGSYGDVTNIGSIVSNMFLNPITIAIIGVIVVASGGIGYVFGGGAGGAAKNVPLCIGIGIFISLIASLWYSTTQVVFSIDSTNNAIIAALIAIVTICIGILLVFTIAEMFMGQQGVDT